MLSEFVKRRMGTIIPRFDLDGRYFLPFDIQEIKGVFLRIHNKDRIISAG